MVEVEIKAHASEGIKEFFDARYGTGREVHKHDHYFRRPGERIQALRIRSYNGIVELTTKKTGVISGSENNEEYRYEGCYSNRNIASCNSFYPP